MSNGSFEIPVGYGDINLYNAQFSPSTVHVKNTALQRYFRKYLLQKAISVFKWTLPEEWDEDYFRYVLYGIGYIAVLETRTFGVICQGGALGGYNLYYRPSYIIVTNPHLKETITANIGTDCAIIKLQPDYSSIMDIVGFYADQMALCAEALGMNLVNVKTGVVFGAENKTQAESYKKMYDQLGDGNPAVFIGKNLMDDQGKPSWYPFVQNMHEQYITSDILSDMRKIEAMYDTEIGIPNANTDKKERLVTDEINANNVETATRCELWLDSIRKGIKQANDMYGLSLAVDWRVNPQTEIEDNWKGGEE
ncbi:MAG: hypothetical protein J6V25_02435 [Oscillospiraceae bacterium]|nr:hypothetical protein [Oscillospiraceae bacterium]